MVENSHAELLDLNRSVLLVIDVQEKFVPTLFNEKKLPHACINLIEAAKQLGVPVVVTEQYPQGLGPTLESVKAHCPENTTFFEKTSFGCCDEPGFDDLMRGLFSGKEGPYQVVVCGLESHICVNQTVTRLLQQGYQVHLVTDAIGSRDKQNTKLAKKKLFLLGAIPSGVEMVLFEWMRSSKHPAFKPVQELIK